MTLDLSALAAQIARRARALASPPRIDRAALLRALSALDVLEQDWRCELAVIGRSSNRVARVKLLDEMLAADVLFRTWTAFVGIGVDHTGLSTRTQHTVGLLVQTLLQQRRRLLTALIESDFETDEVARLDRRRRVCERWSDVLLCIFPNTTTTRALRFDEQRTDDFLRLWNTEDAGNEPVIMTAMRAALPPLALTRPSRFGQYTDLTTWIRSTLPRPTPEATTLAQSNRRLEA